MPPKSDATYSRKRIGPVTSNHPRLQLSGIQITAEREKGFRSPPPGTQLTLVNSRYSGSRNYTVSVANKKIQKNNHLNY